ncbi:MAG: hypothetical protein OEW78_07525 [Nitrosopumilus sp.]|uniref:hypothetical protein n=1 Tax=Nitrosopumilus sp. TaxID=2024843 RepID=UPI00246ADE55|nr:hypothetical protein [Nitrosopumilus sp.]MDH5431712.1 hypothetical protein [Nitrosopumilus sp.]
MSLVTITKRHQENKLSQIRSDAENALLVREKILSDFAGLSCLIMNDYLED